MKKKKQPLISIVTVVFNDVKNIEETIISTLSQKFDDFEYIIIDGGSTDGTIDIIKRYIEKIDIFKSEPDLNVYDGMNKGKKLSSGKYLNYLNSGDIFYSENTLNFISNILYKNDTDFIYGNVILISGDDKRERVLHSLKLSQIYLYIFGSRVLCHQSVFVRKTISLDFNIKYNILADYNWYIDLLKMNPALKIKRINLSLIYYRLGGKSERSIYRKYFERIDIIYTQFGFLCVFTSAILIASQSIYSVVRNLLLRKKKLKFTT